MRYISLLLVTSIIFFSCDDRRDPKLKFRSGSESFKMNFAEYSNNYVPVDMLEIQTDTIIEQHFKVSIRNYSIPNDAILVTRSESNPGFTQTYHRRFAADIMITNSEDELLNETLSLEQFMDQPTMAFWRNATFEHVWVNQEMSSKSRVTINVSIKNPQEDSYRLYQFQLYKNGRKSIELVEKSA